MVGNRNLSHGPAAAFAVVALWATVSVDLAASASISPASAEEPRGSALLARAATETPPIFSGTATFLELTTPQAASARPLKASDIVHGSISYDGGEEDRWIVTNPYLPGAAISSA